MSIAAPSNLRSTEHHAHRPDEHGFGVYSAPYGWWAMGRIVWCNDMMQRVGDFSVGGIGKFPAIAKRPRLCLKAHLGLLTTYDDGVRHERGRKRAR